MKQSLNLLLTLILLFSICSPLEAFKKTIIYSVNYSDDFQISRYEVNNTRTALERLNNYLFSYYDIRIYELTQFNLDANLRFYDFYHIRRQKNLFKLNEMSISKKFYHNRMSLKIGNVKNIYSIISRYLLGGILTIRKSISYSSPYVISFLMGVNQTNYKPVFNINFHYLKQKDFFINMVGTYERMFNNNYLVNCLFRKFFDFNFLSIYYFSTIQGNTRRQNLTVDYNSTSLSSLFFIKYYFNPLSSPYLNSLFDIGATYHHRTRKRTIFFRIYLPIEKELEYSISYGLSLRRIKLFFQSMEFIASHTSFHNNKKNSLSTIFNFYPVSFLTIICSDEFGFSHSFENVNEFFNKAGLNLQFNIFNQNLQLSFYYTYYQKANDILNVKINFYSLL